MKAEAEGGRTSLRGAIIALASEVAAPEREALRLADAVLIGWARPDAHPTPRDVGARLACEIGQAGRPLLIRVAPFSSGETEADLAAFVPAAPTAVVLPGSSTGADVQRLGAWLAVAEAEAGRPDGATAIVAEIGTAATVLAAAGLAGSSPRLCGILWNGAATAAELGAAEGSAPVATARSLALLAAAAAGVPAIDASQLGPDEARREGFAAKVGGDARVLAAIRDAYGAVRSRSGG